jgi:hypothetical protein
LRGGREGVGAHGAGVAAAQAQHVVGRHGEFAGALQGEDLDLADGLDRLVVGDGGQVQRGASGELEDVDARAAGDAAAGGQLGLQVGASDGDGVATTQGVECAAGVAERVVAWRGAVELRAVDQGVVRRWGLRGEGQVVDVDVTIPRRIGGVGVDTPQLQIDGLGAGGRVGGIKMATFQAGRRADVEAHTVYIHTQTATASELGNVVQLEYIGLSCFNSRRRFPENRLAVSGNVGIQNVARESAIRVDAANKVVFRPTDARGCSTQVGIGRSSAAWIGLNRCITGL